MYHVEIHHSESDEISPFAVRDAPANLSQQEHSTASASRQERNQSASSNLEIDYAECPYRCGERLPIEELGSHTDLHIAENAAYEDTSTMNSTEFSTGPCHDTDALKSISNTFDTTIAAPLRNYGSTDTTTISKSNKHRRTPSLKDLFFSSPTKHRKQPKDSSVQNGTIKRLGVC